VWIDTLTLSPRVLTFALETFGAERVMVGSDYPFRLGSDDPVGALQPLGFDTRTRARITRDNARDFLGLG
jgi:aminocarboxymuconate-semialdehyde decarboxylase